jgi:hypothetical protein
MIENDNKANDKIVYFGVININENGKNIGALSQRNFSVKKKG